MYRTKCENNQRARTKGHQISGLCRKIEELNLTTMDIACDDCDKLTNKGNSDKPIKDESRRSSDNASAQEDNFENSSLIEDLPQGSGVSTPAITAPPLFLQPLMPAQMPIVPDVARHGLEVTQFGAIGIRHREFIPTKPNVYRGKRGKDKKKRKPRLCKKCKTMKDGRIMQCKGGSGKGCCKFYTLSSDDGKIVSLS